MKAAVLPGYDQARQKLSDIVPLDAPFTLFISPTQCCNFKCFYCTHGKSKAQKSQLGFLESHMSGELFEKICRQAAEFNGRIKRVVFTGMGEPLVNPNLPNMIKRLSEGEVAGGYETITNAYLLSHEMSDALIQAGLTYLRISIQGLSEEKYKAIAGTAIDFNRLIENIKYFYEHRGSCKVYLKIMDACLDSEETEEKFFQLFGDLCDKIYVEHLTKAQPSMMDGYDDSVDSKITFYGEPSKRREVCPYMFYTLQVDAEGNTFPCPPLGLPMEFSQGNVRNDSLYDIWNSAKLHDLYKLQLQGKRNEIRTCDGCENYLCFTPEEDNLDMHKTEILKRLEMR